MSVSPAPPSVGLPGRSTPAWLAGATYWLPLLLLLVLGELVIGWGLDRFSNQLLYVALAGPLLAAAVLCFVSWRATMYLIFAQLFVEGFFRNFLNSPNILLLKDGLLCIVYLRILIDAVSQRTSSQSIPPLVVPLAAFTLLVLIQTLNPNLASGTQILIGLRTWLFYVPLYFVGRRMLAEERHLRWFVWFILACGVPICILAIYQWNAGYEAYASLGPGFADGTFVTFVDQENIISSGLVYRPNATFSWPTHFAFFLALITLLGFGALLVPRARLRERAVYAAVFALFLGTNVVAGQRSMLVLLPPLLGIVFAFRLNFRRILASIAGLSVIVAVMLIFRDVANVQRVLDLFSNQDGVIGERAWYYWGNIVQALDVAPYGLGTGATGLGSRYVTDLALMLEVPQARVIGDLSVLGLLLYLIMMGATLVGTLYVRARADHAGRGFISGVAAAVVGFQLLVLYGGYDLGILAIPFWFLSGALSQVPTAGNGEPGEVGRASLSGAASPSLGRAQTPPTNA